MADLETIFEDCLQRVAAGEISAEQCLADHPEHAEALRRLFAAQRALEKGRGVRASRAMRARGRARLRQHMRDNPRLRSGLLDQLLPRPMRTAGAIAGLLVAFLVTGTALAQTALPGDALYPWKRWSERTWLTIAPQTDRAQRQLLERRAAELIAVQEQPQLAQAARQHYLDTVRSIRASAHGLNADELMQILGEHHSRFQSQGVEPPLAAPEGGPDAAPQVSPTPAPDALPEQSLTPPLDLTDPLEGALETPLPTIDLDAD